MRLPTWLSRFSLRRAVLEELEALRARLRSGAQEEPYRRAVLKAHPTGPPWAVREVRPLSSRPAAPGGQPVETRLEVRVRLERLRRRREAPAQTAQRLVRERLPRRRTAGRGGPEQPGAPSFHLRMQGERNCH